MRVSRFAAAAWAVLVVNLGVVLWGAYVRASGSGAGCGSHWPLCNGQVVPRAAEVATRIEFTHRLTSGVAFLLVAGLLLWAVIRRAEAGGTSLRGALRAPWGPELRAAALAMLFMISEALVGAGLVLFGLTGDDDSVARAVVLGVHLVNTFFLLGFIALTAWFGSGGAPVRLRGQGRVGALLLSALAGTLLLGVTGAVTALGDTLFPAATLAEGVRRDFSPTAHFLERLRVIHPLLAVGLGLYMLVVAHGVLRARADGATRALARALVALFFVQLAAGAVNLLLMAPIWMQLVHLLLADLLWIALVLLTAAALRDVAVAAPATATPPRPSPPARAPLSAPPPPGVAAPR